MTDNEIIKALEYCVSVNSCDDCKKPTPRICTTFETKDFLDLINRQKAEIERLQEIIIMGKFTSPIAIRAQQSWYRQNRENINRLNEEIKKFKEECSCLGCENEWLKAHYEQVKAEAVKEFTEKLQDRCNAQEGCIYASDIGAVLKEMVGEI